MVLKSQQATRLPGTEEGAVLPQMEGKLHVSFIKSESQKCCTRGNNVC